MAQCLLLSADIYFFQFKNELFSWENVNKSWKSPVSISQRCMQPNAVFLLYFYDCRSNILYPYRLLIIISSKYWSNYSQPVISKTKGCNKGCTAMSLQILYVWYGSRYITWMQPGQHCPLASEKKDCKPLGEATWQVFVCFGKCLDRPISAKINKSKNRKVRHQKTYICNYYLLCNK